MVSLIKLEAGSWLLEAGWPLAAGGFE